MTATRVPQAAGTFAIAGGLVALVVVRSPRLETWGLHFPGR